MRQLGHRNIQQSTSQVCADNDAATPDTRIKKQACSAPSSNPAPFDIDIVTADASSLSSEASPDPLHNEHKVDRRSVFGRGRSGLLLVSLSDIYKQRRANA